MLSTKDDKEKREINYISSLSFDHKWISARLKPAHANNYSCGNKHSIVCENNYSNLDFRGRFKACSFYCYAGLFEEGNRKCQWKWKLDFACTFNHYFSMKFCRKLPWTPNNQSPMLSQKLSNSLEKNSTSKCSHCFFSYKQNTEIDKLWLKFATSFTSGKNLRKVSFIALMYLL